MASTRSADAADADWITAPVPMLAPTAMIAPTSRNRLRRCGAVRWLVDLMSAGVLLVALLVVDVGESNEEEIGNPFATRIARAPARHQAGAERFLSGNRGQGCARAKFPVCNMFLDETSLVAGNVMATRFPCLARGMRGQAAPL